MAYHVLVNQIGLHPYGYGSKRFPIHRTPIKSSQHESSGSMLVDTWQTNLLMCLKLIIGYDIDNGVINWSKNYLWLSGVWCPSPTPYRIYKRQTLCPYVKCWVCLATFLFENGLNTNILNFNSLSLVELQLWAPLGRDSWIPPCLPI